MTIVPNSQSFSPQASGTLVSSLAARFKAGIDTVLIGGRDILVHLPPGKSVCPAACRFNSTYNKYIGLDGKMCRACKGQGFVMEPRQTIYRANIRWTDEPLASPRGGGEDTPAGRVSESLVRTKTVIESLNHLKQALSIEVDGISCTLWDEPRPTGWGNQLFYVVAFWKKNNRQI